MISNMIELKEAKAQYKLKIDELHERFKSNKRFGVDQRLSKKNVYVMETHESLSILKEDVKAIINLDTSIKEAVGKAAYLPHPLIRVGVDYARIWTNRAVGNKKDSLTKDDIIKRLEHKLQVQKRLYSEAALEKQIEILTQINYFKDSDEQQYILRSAPSPDCIIKLYYSSGETERIRITKSGLFLVGTDFNDVTIAQPDDGKLGLHNTMASIYAQIKPVPYFCSISGSLYPESVVEELKESLEKEKASRSSYEGLNSKNGTNDLD